MKVASTKNTKKHYFYLCKYLCYLFGVAAFIFYLVYLSHKGEAIASVFGILANLCTILALITMYLLAYIKFKGKYNKYSGILIWHSRDIGWGASFNPFSLAGKLLWLLMITPFLYYLYLFLS